MLYVHQITISLFQISVRHLSFVVEPIDRIGFLDLSLTPCVTYTQTSGNTPFITVFHANQSQTSPTKGTVGHFLFFQNQMIFNVLADIERKLNFDSASKIVY